MQEDGQSARVGVGDLDADVAVGRADHADGHRGALPEVVDGVRHQLARTEADFVAVVAEVVAQFRDGLRGGEQAEFEGHRSAASRSAAASARAVAVLQFPSVMRPAGGS